jgi:hypothetical protein
MTFLFNLLFLTGLVSRFLAGTPAVSSDTSFAYLDPGTGTMIISAIVGIFATVALGVKTFWYKIAHFFKSDTNKSKKGPKSNRP